MLLWLIPVFAGLTLCVGVMKGTQKLIALIAGLLPFAFLIVGLFHEGEGLLHVLEPGAYVGLTLGLLLSILSRWMK